MFRIKYFTFILLVLMVTGCGGQRELSDEEYFKETTDIMYEFKDTFDGLFDSLDTYNADKTAYAQMEEPGEKAYDIFTKEVKELNNIKPVAGWESRHANLVEDITYFQDLAREAVRTSKDGNMRDLSAQLGNNFSKLDFRLKSLNRLSEFYYPKVEE